MPNPEVQAQIESGQLRRSDKGFTSITEPRDETGATAPMDSQHASDLSALEKNAVIVDVMAQERLLLE